MKKKIYIFSLVLLVAACNRDEINSLKSQLSFEKSKNSLLAYTDSDTLLSTISQNQSSHQYELTFENGETLQVPNGEILSYSQDRNAWSTTILLSDSSVIILPSHGDLQIPATTVKLDPFARNPLSALVKISMPVKGKFKIRVLGKTTGGVSIENTFADYGTYHEIPVLGLYENYENSVEFTFMDAHNNTRSTQTIKLKTVSTPHTTVQLNTNTFSDSYRGIYFPAQGGIGVDQRGEVRWLYTGDQQLLLTSLKNGNVIITSGINLKSYHSPVFYEVTMLGEIVFKYTVLNYLHHDVFEMPSGNFLVLTNSTLVNFSSPNSREDYVIEMERNTGTVLKSWDLRNTIDPNRVYLPDTGGSPDWCHANAVFFDNQDNSVVVSSRSQSLMVKMDYNNPELVKWIFGSNNGWGDSFKPFLLSPVDQSGNAIDPSTLDFWSYGQHSPKLLDNGDILVYDNGAYRGFYENPSASQNSYTRIAEYKIDPLSKKVQLVWQNNFNKQYFTEFTGSVALSSSNTYVVGIPKSNTQMIVEVAQNNQLLFSVTFGTTSMYRGFRFDLYPSSTNQ